MIPGRKRIQFTITEEQIQRLLTDDTYNLSQIAREHGVSRQTVSSRLKELKRKDVNQRLKYKFKNYQLINNQGKNVEGRKLAREMFEDGHKTGTVIEYCHVDGRTARRIRDEVNSNQRVGHQQVSN